MVITGAIELFHGPKGLLYERPLQNASESVADYPFEWNAAETVCTLCGGGPVVFKGIIRGGDMSPLTYIGPSEEVVTYGMALNEWIYTLKHSEVQVNV